MYVPSLSMYVPFGTRLQLSINAWRYCTHAAGSPSHLL